MAVEDALKRVKEQKRIRIDHSDVHLQNGRLGEQLGWCLDEMARKRHRQSIIRDHELHDIRQDLQNLHLARKAASTFRPKTAPINHSPKPPPSVLKLNVHVPPSNQSCTSSEDSHDNSDEEDDLDNRLSKSDRLRRKQQRQRVGPPASYKQAVKAKKQNGRQSVKKLTREQVLLHNLNLEAIPPSWYTQVHLPADLPLRSKRAASAQPAFRSYHSQGPPSAPRRPRPKTVATTLTPSQEAESNNPENQEKKTLSRRRLIQLTRQRSQSTLSDADVSRRQFLDAISLERDYLDLRVKLFVQSCDKVSTGGVGSSRRVRGYHRFMLPQQYC